MKEELKMKENDTRQLLADSLYELAMDRPLDKITVKQISEKAGVTSQTFYNHFKDKYDLILSGHKYRVNRLIKELREDKVNWDEFIEIYLSSYEKNSKFIVNAFKNTCGEDSYAANTGRYICECLEEEIRIRAGIEPDKNTKLLIKVYASGVINIMAYWLAEDTDITKEDMKKALVDALPEKLRELFKSKNYYDNM